MVMVTQSQVDSSPLTQYLNVSSNGNVFVEFAIDVNRYRLCCKKCSQILTYSYVHALPTLYEKEGLLDASIQKFAKEHRHEGWVSYKTTLSVMKSPRQEAVAVDLSKCPRRTHGRKFKP